MAKKRGGGSGIIGAQCSAFHKDMGEKGEFAVKVEGLSGSAEVECFVVFKAVGSVGVGGGSL